MIFPFNFFSLGCASVSSTFHCLLSVCCGPSSYSTKCALCEQVFFLHLRFLTLFKKLYFISSFMVWLLSALTALDSVGLHSIKPIHKRGIDICGARSQCVDHTKSHGNQKRRPNIQVWHKMSFKTRVVDMNRNMDLVVRLLLATTNYVWPSCNPHTRKVYVSGRKVIVFVPKHSCCMFVGFYPIHLILHTQLTL